MLLRHRNIDFDLALEENLLSDKKKFVETIDKLYSKTVDKESRMIRTKKLYKGIVRFYVHINDI